MIICPNLKNPDVAREFEELKNATSEKAAYYIWSLNNGNGIDKAPNGAESILFKSLLDYYEGDRTKAIRVKAKTYGKSFLQWFGNWTGQEGVLSEYEQQNNVSKVVDENGEPLLIFHTTDLLGDPNFDTFNTHIEGFETAIYGTDSYDMSASYMDPESVEFTLDEKYENTPDIPFYVDRLSEEYPDIDWHNFDYESLPKHIKEDEHVKTFNYLLRLNDVDGLRAASNVREYNNHLVEHEINRGDHIESYWTLRPTRFTKVLFVNLKNPVVIDTEYKDWNRIDSWKIFDLITIKDRNSSNYGSIKPEFKGNTSYLYKETKDGLEKKETISTRDIENTFRNTDYDGIIINNVRDYGSLQKYRPSATVTIAYTSNQVKSINNEGLSEYEGTFSIETGNIYHNLLRVDNLPEVRNRLLKLGAIVKHDGGFRLSGLANAKELISNICKQYGTRATFYKLESGVTKVSFNTNESKLKPEVQDKIDKDLGVSYVDGTREELEKQGRVIIDVVDFLKQKFPQLKVEFINQSDLKQSRFADVNKRANSFIIGDTVYLIRGRMTSEVAIEELLHPLVYTIANQNFELFQDFIKEAKKDFPKLAAQIKDRYTDNLGFNEFNRQLELVTQVLARYVNKKYKSGQKESKLSDLIQKFFNYIGVLMSSYLKKFTGKDHDFDDIKKMTLEELSDIVLAKDSKFKVYTTSTPYHSIQSRQEAARAESQRLIVRMNILHNEYEKMTNKTKSQQTIANKIFETLNELKRHRDISAVAIALRQAMESVGYVDKSTGLPVAGNNVYTYLYKQAQNGFAGLNPQQLVDMYRNSIKFYKDLIEGIPSDQVIDLTPEDIADRDAVKSMIDNYIMPLWVQAITKVADDVIDQQIDQEVESSEENKEEMKKVAKDWLHKNLMYGDISAVTSYVYNYSNSSNPIIKQAFHIIQHAEQKTLEEVHTIAPALIRAYQQANKGSRSFTPGWQSVMMEFDEDGLPTGNFVRDLNYGQYNKDLKEFREQLNDKFLKKYGYTYVTDDIGAIVNSLTGEFAEDEEWNGDIMPHYVEYQREIELFKNKRCHRRFTADYYLERLSKPYDGTIDPMSPEFKGTRFDHGLSPKTLARYSYYHSNINYYLSKCQDEDTGYTYPERLSKEEKRQLDLWQSQLDRFSDIFELDGSYKTGEDLKMAYEVRAWQKYSGEFNDQWVRQQQFNQELAEVRQRAQQENNPALVDDFLKYNAVAGINPDYINQVLGHDFLKKTQSDTDKSHRARIIRKALQDSVKNIRLYTRNLEQQENNPLFWLRCKMSDQAIEDDRKNSHDPDRFKTFEEHLYNREILYTDDHGFYIDRNGNKINPQDPNVEQLEKDGNLLTFRQYLINKYTNEAVRNGYVQGLVDESTGNLIDFSQMNTTQIRRSIVKLMSYRRKTFNKDGSVTEEYVPLSIFTMLTPKEKTFVNVKTGITENTIVYVGSNRFVDVKSSFKDSKYKEKLGTAEQPDRLFDNGRYDNTEAYNKVINDPALSNLYDACISTMQQMQGYYSTNKKFNYRLPQINAHSAALYSRLLRRGFTTKALQGIWQSITSIEENDDDMRVKDDYFVGVDGEVANDVPLKFIRPLKNPENISTDVVSSVIMFADMAINYKNKRGIDATLKLLRYNMEQATRETDKSKYGVFGGRKITSNENSIKMYDSMMDVLMYGNKWAGKPEEGGPSKTQVALHKSMDAFQSLESTAMLGLNMFSMSVGFADSLTRIFSESLAGKYMTAGDCLYALGTVLYYTPACLKNIFNPLANNKLTALMQINGISKGTYGTYVKADWGKGRKFVSNLLMGGWSMLDWMANALLMTAFYHNVRFYDGDVVEKGFYSRYELQQAFKRAGHSKHEATLAHHGYGDLLKGKARVTLWDAYEFAPYVDDGQGNKIKLHGQVRVKPEFEQYVTQKLKTRIATKTKKRGALYNGMNPDNDVPRWKRDVLGRLAGALRGWIVQQLQHLIAGGTDNVSRDFDEMLEFETTSSGTRLKKKFKRKSLTDEQRSKRFAWDYETGTPQDQIMIGLYRSVKTAFRIMWQTITLKDVTAKFSEVEKYAWTDALIYTSMLAMMMVAWIFVHEDAGTVPPPENREEAGPKTWYNPYDYYAFFRDVYIPNQYYKLAVDDIFFRTIEAKISNINPQQVLDIVNAYTALKSGLEDQLGLFSYIPDLFSTESEMDEVLKQGSYKFYTKGDRVLYRSLGPVKNMHTWMTYYGATSNLRYYTNKFGKLYRAAGYDFKKKDKKKEQKSGLSGGNLSGGNLTGGKLTGGKLSN